MYDFLNRQMIKVMKKINDNKYSILYKHQNEFRKSLHIFQMEHMEH
jgi:hypothetical protein